MTSVEAARELARSFLAKELPRRWAHSTGVAGQAAVIGRVVGSAAGLLQAAAWLHDVGYATPLNKIGFHPIDGARYLRDNGFGDRELWTMVAHHTCAHIEAEMRGFEEILSEEFPADAVDPFLVDALSYCDLTTGPDGQRLEVEERLAEILERYGPEDLVYHAISRASPVLRRQVAGVVTRLNETPS